MNLEESKTDERYQIKKLTKLDMSNIQKPREDDDLDDTDTNMEHDP